MCIRCLVSKWTKWVGISGLIKLVSYSLSGATQISNTQRLHVFQSDLAILVDIQSIKEGVDVFLLRVVAGVEYSVCVCQNGHSLTRIECTLTGSITPVLSLS